MKNWLQNLSLYAKLVILSSFSALLLALGGCYFIFLIHNVTVETKEITLEVVPSVHNVSIMNIALNYYREQEFRHVISPTKGEKDSVHNNMRNSLRKLRTAAERYKHLANTPIEQDLYRQFYTQLNNYIAISETVHKLSYQNQVDSARKVLVNASLELFKEANSTLGKLTEITLQREEQTYHKIEKIINSSQSAVLWGTLGFIIVQIGSILFLGKGIIKPIKLIGLIAERVGQGNTDQVITDSSLLQRRDEIADVAHTMNRMILALENNKLKKNSEQWLANGRNKLNSVISPDKNIEQICLEIIAFVTQYIGAQIGALYIVNEEQTELFLAGTYCAPKSAYQKADIVIGSGIIGQAAAEQKIVQLQNLEDGYGHLVSAFGEYKPNNVIIIPCVFQGSLYAILEIVSFDIIQGDKYIFLESISEPIAIALQSGIAKVQIENLLETTQQRAEDLAVSYEEITRQQEVLTQQTHEIEIANSELLEKNAVIEEQQKELMQVIKEAHIYKHAFDSFLYPVMIIDAQDLRIISVNQHTHSFFRSDSSPCTPEEIHAYYSEFLSTEISSTHTADIVRTLQDNRFSPYKVNLFVKKDNKSIEFTLAAFVCEYGENGHVKIFAEVFLPSV